MQIVIPMSGLGSRFKAVGYTDPKPLIEVDGKPMIEWVVRLFPGEKDFVFICLEEHLKTTKMVDTLQRIAPHGKIVSIAQKIKGPVANILDAQSEIDDDKPTIVSYCDFYGQWDYAGFKKFLTKADPDGALPAYTGFHPHLLHPENLYASCRVDGNGQLVEIREKYSFTEDKTKTHHSPGIHYMKSGRMLKDYSQKLVDRDINLNSEYYASLLYNLLVEDGRKTLLYPMDKFCQWGTPKDLAEFNYWLEYFKKKHTMNLMKGVS